MNKVRFKTLNVKPGHEGLGDTIYWIAHYMGIHWIIKKLKINCGCEKRRLRLNKLVNYGKYGTKL